MKVGDSFGVFPETYISQKIASIRKRLIEKHNYSEEDVDILLEQYNIWSDDNNIEKLEHDILESEKIERDIAENNKEDNLMYVDYIKSDLLEKYKFNDMQARKIISKCVWSLYTAMNVIKDYYEINKVRNNIFYIQEWLLEVLNIDTDNI